MSFIFTMGNLVETFCLILFLSLGFSLSQETTQPPTHRLPQVNTTRQPATTKPTRAPTTRPTRVPTTRPTTTQPTTLTPFADILCDKTSKNTCNVSNSERCVLVRERAGRCQCLPGHARGHDGRTCIAVKYYRSELLTGLVYSDDMADPSSAIYRKTEYQAREGLFKALQKSKLRTIAVDVHIRYLLRSTDDHMVIAFEISLSRSYAPEAHLVEADLSEGIRAVTLLRGYIYYLDDTEIPLDIAQVENLRVTAPDPCSDPIMNYCDPNAICLSTVRSFMCRCRSGFEDVSLDKMEAPGEACELICGCKNDGVCKYNENGKKMCKCPSWYLGEHCEIDGKILLIGIAAILGGLLLIGIICCACCLWRMKDSREKSDTISTTSADSGRRDNYPGTYKVPRSWMDTWRYYSFTPAAYQHQQVLYPPTMVHPQPSRHANEDQEDGNQSPLPLAIPRPHLVTPHPPRYYRPEHWYWHQNYHT